MVTYPEGIVLPTVFVIESFGPPIPDYRAIGTIEIPVPETILNSAYVGSTQGSETIRVIFPVPLKFGYCVKSYFKLIV